MKNLSIKNLISVGLILIICSFSSQAYSQKKNKRTRKNAGVTLEYKYLTDKYIQYVTTTKIIQDMDINGSSMLVNVDSYQKCGITSAGMSGENLRLKIRIDSMFQNIDSPQGSAGGVITDAAGKEFALEITKAGKAADFSEASKLVINIPGSGESDASEAFSNFFPVLPLTSVKVGDTWVTNDTLTTKGKTTSRVMPVKAECKFEGTENINDIECAKITATLTGEMKTTTFSQGMEIIVNGPFTGNTVLFFAIKEGYFVKETSNIKVNGTIEIPDQGMSFPVTMDVATVNEMAK